MLLFLAFPLIHSLSIFLQLLPRFSSPLSHCQPRRLLLILKHAADAPDAGQEMFHHLMTPLLRGDAASLALLGYSGLCLHQATPCMHFWLHSCPGQSRCQKTIGQKTENVSLDKGEKMLQSGLQKKEFKSWHRDFPGGPVVKTPGFHRRGRSFNPWSGN